TRLRLADHGRLEHCTELRFVFPQRILRADHGIDVRYRAHPPDDLSIFPPHWDATDEHPSILPILAAKTHAALVHDGWIFLGDRAHPESLGILGVERLHPTIASGLLRC